MKAPRSTLSPLVAFVGIQLAWILVVAFWVHWFLRSHRRFREIALRYSPELAQGGVDWVLLVEGLVLLAAILAGVYVIFLYWRRQTALYREQKRLVSQVTHELKSPLASLRLYLETIRLCRPPARELQGFVDTMLEDTERLEGLIDNLLTANRLEQRGIKLALRPGDLSAFVAEYCASRRGDLPDGAALELEVEPGLWARFERESLGVVLRNLLENAVLYSPGPPRIQVRLRRRNRRCHLSVRDWGRGLDPREQKRVFRMFYRVKAPDRRVEGTGLGLFIAKAIVLRHKGRIWAESDGPGTGSTFHVLLPRIDPPVAQDGP
ncbi:MAG: HAMP domain-containing sensor histidine kinase [Deferrisomatales bacterium]